MTTQSELKAPQKTVSRTINRKKSVQIGHIFEEARIRAGLSTAQLARCLEGISESDYRSYLAGLKTMPLAHIYAISNCLNISPDNVVEILILNRHP